MKITINSKNFRKPLESIKELSKHEFEKLEICIDSKNEPPWEEVIPKIYEALEYESRIPIWLSGIPFCFINECAHDHVLAIKNDNKPSKECKDCKYQNICPGPPANLSKEQKQKLVKPIRDKPKEIMIEAESKCNFDCYFCYNHNSFAAKGRPENNLSFDYIKKIIDHVSDLDIKIIRFTGGEPLLRKDIRELMAYAKSKDLEVRLNTNASLVTKEFAESLKGILDNVLIPIESFTDQKETEITGFTGALFQKIKAIEYFHKAGIPVVRVGTVATKYNIENFEKLAGLILEFPVKIWEFYRPISTDRNNAASSFDRQDVQDLVKNITKQRQKSDKNIIIANALPFCAISNPQTPAFISSGALFDEGHSRMVIDPKGFVKPHYFIDRNIGDPLDLETAWNDEFMVKMRKLQFLPEQCSNCLYQRKCAGGSRFEAEMRTGDQTAPDPLADLANKII
jgi:radical SAM protein with 4Fe4S-binding SPASM domain